MSALVAVLTAVTAGVSVAAISFLVLLWASGRTFDQPGIPWLAVVGALLLGLVAGVAVLVGMVIA